MDDERCVTCGQTKTWHDEVKPQHLFVAEGSSSNGGAALTKPPKPPPLATAPKGDLILRLTLLQKGIITEADLRHTEFWVHESVVRAQALEVVPDVENGGYKFTLTAFEEVGQKR